MVRRNQPVVPSTREENRQNRCENRDGRVGDESTTPMAIRPPSLGLPGHGFDESIPFRRHRLDVSRARALVPKGYPEAADNDVQAVIDDDVFIRPQPVLDGVTSNQLTGPLE